MASEFPIVRAINPAAECASSSSQYSFPPEASKPCAERRSARPRSLSPAECGSPPFVPSAVNGQKNLRQLPDKFRLQFRSDHQVAVTFILGGQRGKDPASHTEVGSPHM